MWDDANRDEDPSELFVNDNAKRSVSLRVNTSDFGRIKAIAQRLHARESDVFRFAIRIALSKLAPLYDSNARGGALMPVFAECGTAVAEHFNLDARRLAHVLNADVDDEARRVDMDDVELLSMAGVPDRYLAMRLQELLGEEVAPGEAMERLCRYIEDKYLPPAARGRSRTTLKPGRR